MEAKKPQSSFAARMLGKALSWGVPKRKPKNLSEAEQLARGMLRNYIVAAVAISPLPASTGILALVDTKLYQDIAKIYQIPNFNIDGIVAAAAAVTERAPLLRQLALFNTSTSYPSFC